MLIDSVLSRTDKLNNFFDAQRATLDWIQDSKPRGKVNEKGEEFLNVSSH
jgi:hypothetical protein